MPGNSKGQETENSCDQLLQAASKRYSVFYLESVHQSVQKKHSDLSELILIKSGTGDRSHITKKILLRVTTQHKRFPRRHMSAIQKVAWAELLREQAMRIKMVLHTTNMFTLQLLFNVVTVRIETFVMSMDKFIMTVKEVCHILTPSINSSLLLKCSDPKPVQAD
jgi:hypothetical protein